jgi:hypothetical protein
MMEAPQEEEPRPWLLEAFSQSLLTSYGLRSRMILEMDG